MNDRLDPGMAAARLEEVARQLRTRDYAPQRLWQMLAPVSAWLYEQTLPPCTCGEWQGPDWSQSWHCYRHHLGAGNVSTPPNIQFVYPAVEQEAT